MLKTTSILKFLIAVLTFSVVSSGCVSDQASRYFLNERLPAKQVQQVQLLDAPPSSPYEIIAEFQSRGETPEDMRRKAAEVGADAVIVVLAGGLRLHSAEWASERTDSYTRIIGSAIRFKK